MHNYKNIVKNIIKTLIIFLCFHNYVSKEAFARHVLFSHFQHMHIYYVLYYIYIIIYIYYIM